MSLKKLLIRDFEQDEMFAAEELSQQIIEWVTTAHAKGGVLGLSGGVDSTTVALLCHKAFGNYNQAHPKTPLTLRGLILPSKANSPDDERDGVLVAKTLKIPYQIIPIEPIARVYEAALPQLQDDHFHRGNLYAEIRATLLSREAAIHHSLLMGTGNWIEDYVLGYFTKRGDGAVDNNILGELSKDMVKRLARYLGTPLGLPESLINRVSTAGLWQGQTDEKELGYSYSLAHVVWEGHEQGFSPEEISQVIGIPLEVVRSAFEDILKRHQNSEHKRHVPPVGKVGLAMRPFKNEAVK